jgi:phage terminase large subunit-like protein
MIKGVQYAEDVMSGKVLACQWVKLACNRFLEDLKSGNYYLDEEKYKTITAFTGVMKHYASGAAGKPFILEPWEDFIVLNLFCLYRADTKRRKYKTAHISVSRKNGKTTLAAALGLFGLVADGEPAASVIMAANSRDQAHIDFDCAAAFARQLDPKKKNFKVLRNEIVFQKNNAKLKVISADATKLDGSNDSLIIFDEIHEAPDSKLYDVLRSGQGFRQQPLMLSITTAGYRIGGFCNQLEDYCKEVLAGQKEDDTLFALLYTLDDGDDWTDPGVYVKSNPNLGITVNREWLLEQVNQARNSPALEVGVKTKNLNVWCSSSVTWIPEHYIRNSMMKIDLSDFRDKNRFLVYLGFDLAAVSDLTALSIMFVDPETEEYFFKTWYYLPKSALDGKFNSELYKMWSSKGYLVLTDSETTDYNYIQNQILYLYENFDVQGVFFDSWNAQMLVNNLVNEGLPMTPYSQSIGNFNKPTKEIERLILSNKVKMDQNPITRFCFDNVELKVDLNGNAKPCGSHNAGKIDGVISMLNALGGYLDQVYDAGHAFVIPYNKKS